MLRVFALALVLALLVAGAAPASTSAQDAQSDNYCTTVTVTATNTGYTVTATGAGRYARIRDLTAAQTVVATDFGSGATAYTWQGVTLDTAHQYQVQVSHTSLTTGYSTSGCLFVPPPPLAVVVETFAYNPAAGAFEWTVAGETDTIGYQVLGLAGAATAWVPAQAPGSTSGATYSAPAPGIAPGEYVLMAWDLAGQAAEAARTVYQAPTAVELSTFAAGGACRWERKPRLRCQCGPDNPYSPWSYCLRGRR